MGKDCTIFWQVVGLLCMIMLSGCCQAHGYVPTETAAPLALTFTPEEIPTASPATDIQDQIPGTTSIPSTPLDIPGLLLAAWPAPDSIVDAQQYAQRISSSTGRGVGVRLMTETAYAAIVGDEYRSTPFDEKFLPDHHITLWVDGEIMPDALLDVWLIGNLKRTNGNTGVVIYEGSLETEYSWGVPLSAGKYTATVQLFDKEDVKIFEYSWQFTLVE